MLEINMQNINQCQDQDNCNQTPYPSFPGFSPPGYDQEYHELFSFIAWLVGTSVPITTMIILIGVFSGSLTIIAITMDYGLSLCLNIMSLFTLGTVLRKNTFKYPYGTGKLENFTAFVYGVCIIPLAMAVIAAAVKRYLAPPETINLWLTLLFFLALIRLAIFAVWITRLGKKYPRHSPLMQAYHADYRAAVVYETAIFGALLLGLLTASRGGMKIAIAIDITVAFLISLYYLFIACRLILRNFRSLIDLPLNENFQRRILLSLAEEFDAYDGLGTIYTRMSGNEP
jgi:divalent metal cation (Fe/Co/Zn/Cd) transporter